MPKEGKSVTAANLAVAMSEVRQMQILAVDCDLRQGGLGKLLRRSEGPGLADVLAGNAALRDAIHPTPLENLSFLPAGDCGAASPAELLNSTAAARVFEEIRDSYHCTLVDTPPVQQVSDVGVIGGLCTGVVMVVRMNRTDSQIVRQSLRWLQSNNLNILGCIAAACSPKAALSSYRPTGDID
jgi:capsular exopolysaccharide synthesis family protein